MGRRLAGLVAGIAQTGGVIGAIVAFGLGWAGCVTAASGPYTPRPMEPKLRFLVDGFNVLHAGVLRGNDRRGWWREEMRGRLLERVASFEDGEAELFVVFAPSADAWLLAAVGDAEDPARVVIVTADRQLADRARHRGAQVVAPRAFLARCSAPEGA